MTAEGRLTRLAVLDILVTWRRARSFAARRSLCPSISIGRSSGSRGLIRWASALWMRSIASWISTSSRGACWLWLRPEAMMRSPSDVRCDASRIEARTCRPSMASSGMCVGLATTYSKALHASTIRYEKKSIFGRKMMRPMIAAVIDASTTAPAAISFTYFASW